MTPLIPLTVAVPPPARAQSGEVGAPTPLIPYDSSTREGSGALPGEALPEVQGIVIDRLQALDPNAIGLLDPDKEGLGRDLWRGSTRGRLEGLLALLPGDLEWGALRGLARRLLLSRAEPPAAPEPEPEAAPAPEAAAPGEPAAVVTPRFLALRIDRLLALGEVESLHRLLGAVPRMIDDEAIQRARAEISFLRGDLDGGCREVRNGVNAYIDRIYWQKALVICQLVGGERVQAQLGLDLLQERGLGEDQEAFPALFDAVSGGSGEGLPAEAVEKPLAFAALQSAGLNPPEGFLESAPAGLLVAAALSAKTPSETRIAAAEAAAALGALESERLAALYAGVPFSAEELLSAEESGYEGPKLRALRYQRIARRKEPGALARALREALQAAEAAGVYRAMAPLVAEEFRKVPVQGGLAWFAGTAGRALYATGRVENGGAWYRLARDQAVRNTAAKLAVGALYPYYRLAGGPTLSQDGDSVASWRAGLPEDTDPALAERWEALLRAGLAGLGAGEAAGVAPATAPAPAAAGDGPDLVSAEADGTAMADGEGADDADLMALKQASEAGLRGETLLLALGLIGDIPPSEVEPAALQGVLAALVSSGLRGEARAVAIEAAVASGL